MHPKAWNVAPETSKINVVQQVKSSEYKQQNKPLKRSK